MERKAKMHLTNEETLKKFKSSFELVNYAIQLAENMIKSGRDARVKSDMQNRAMLILEEIHEGKDHFDEIESSNRDYDNHSIYDHTMQHPPATKETAENRKYRTAEVFETED